MAKCNGVRCDRCGGRNLLSPNGSYPEGWGSLRIQRGKAFLDTGVLDLCDVCFQAVYEFTRGNG